MTGRGRALTVAALVAALVGVAALAAAVRRGGPDRCCVGGGSVERVGVSDGDSVPRYAADSRAELDRLAADPGRDRSVYALVTLTSYLSPDRVADLVDAAGPGLQTLAAQARVPLPRRQTELVRLAAGRIPADLVAGMADVARRKSRESSELAHRSRSETDAGRRAHAEEGAAVAGAEAAAYRDRCSCVFALVVRAVPGVLVRLSRLDGVRVVDPAPEVTDLRGAVFAAPLPEQIEIVVPPVDDGPVPSAGSPSVKHDDAGGGKPAVSP